MITDNRLKSVFWLFEAAQKYKFNPSGARRTYIWGKKQNLDALESRALLVETVPGPGHLA